MERSRVLLRRHTDRRIHELSVSWQFGVGIDVSEHGMVDVTLGPFTYWSHRR